MSQKRPQRFSKNWFIFFVLVFSLASFLIFVVVGLIHYIFMEIDSSYTWLDLLLTSYTLKYWIYPISYLYLLWLFLKFWLSFIALCFCFIWGAIFLTTSVQLKFYFIKYPEIWTMWTCFSSLLFKQPISGVFILFFKFSCIFIGRNKNLKLSNKVIWKLLRWLILKSLLVVSWPYIEFVWCGVQALLQDWQTPEKTFIKLYKQRVLSNWILQYHYYHELLKLLK